MEKCKQPSGWRKWLVIRLLHLIEWIDEPLRFDVTDHVRQKIAGGASIVLCGNELLIANVHYSIESEGVLPNSLSIDPGEHYVWPEQQAVRRLVRVELPETAQNSE